MTAQTIPAPRTGRRSPEPGAGPPCVRVLPVPVSEPHGLQWGSPRREVLPATQGTLALSFPAQRSHIERDREFGRQPTSSEQLPDPVGVCAALIQAVIEVLGGTRPATQLTRWLTSDVHAAITRRAALATRMRRDAPAPARAAVVTKVRVCEPADGVVEGSGVVVHGERVRAVAVRLEGMDGRWRATAVEVG